MSVSIHRTVVVGPDGKIEITDTELRPGQRVSVTIESEEDTSSQLDGRHIIDIVKDLPGHRQFKTAEDVDEYLRQERASWDE